MHGVEIMYQCLHRLIGGAVGLLIRPLAGEGDDFFSRLAPVPLSKRIEEGPVKAVVARKAGGRPLLLLGGGNQRLGRRLGIGLAIQEFESPGQVLTIEAAIGFFDALRHPVVEVRDALSAVLVVLIGLDRNTGQRGVACDIVRLPQEAVAGAETAAKQLLDVDLATGGGQG